MKIQLGYVFFQNEKNFFKKYFSFFPRLAILRYQRLYQQKSCRIYKEVSSLRRIKRQVVFLLAVFLLAGCGANEPETAAEEAYLDAAAVEEVDLEEESVALAGSPAAVPSELTPVASGMLVAQGAKARIDYSNTQDGYVMVQYTASTDKRLKAQVKGPSTTYTYNLTAGKWETFPLSDGNGSYQIVVYENVSGTKYATVLTASCTVALADEFAPFLRPNQYVDYANAPNTVAKAAELTASLTEPLGKVKAVYDFVVANITYDKQLAASVQSGYLPSLDTVLAKKTGICFDYAALMTGMLRSQEVPCKLVVGYAGTAYHAWISVWSEETGWIDGVIYFDGTSWQRMDPTFASTGNQSASVMQYIGDGKNYTVKYLY